MTEQENRECESALAYVDDMSEWYDAEAEGGSKLEFALKILDQIDRRGRLSQSQRDWCENRIRERYAG